MENLPEIEIDLPRLAQALIERGLMEKSFADMTKDEIMDVWVVCKSQSSMQI